MYSVNELEDKLIDLAFAEDIEIIQPCVVFPKMRWASLTF